MDRIIRMIVSMVIGRLVNRGVRSGINMIGNRNAQSNADDGWMSVQSPDQIEKSRAARSSGQGANEARANQQQIREQQKRAQRGINMLRRFTRF